MKSEPIAKRRHLPGRQLWRRLILSCEIEEIYSIGSGISFRGNVLFLAYIQMIFRNCNGFLQVKRTLDERGDEPRDNMPFDMTVEEPHT